MDRTRIVTDMKPKCREGHPEEEDREHTLTIYTLKDRPARIYCNRCGVEFVRDTSHASGWRCNRPWSRAKREEQHARNDLKALPEEKGAGPGAAGADPPDRGSTGEGSESPHRDR